MSLISVTHVMEGELVINPASSGAYPVPEYFSKSIARTSQDPAYEGGFQLSSDTAFGASAAFQKYLISQQGLAHQGDILGFIFGDDDTTAYAYSSFEMVFHVGEAMNFSLNGLVEKITFSLLETSVQLKRLGAGPVIYERTKEVGEQPDEGPDYIWTESFGISGMLEPGAYSLGLTYRMDYWGTTDGVFSYKTVFDVSPVPERDSTLGLLACALMAMGAVLRRRRMGKR